MYPSGSWRGFWQQESFGRQPMEQFELQFANGVVKGKGIDIIGPFVFRGEYDRATGQVKLIKQYLGKHQVVYLGSPDGEGSILGTWRITHEVFGIEHKGSFLMQPVRPATTHDLPIRDLSKAE